MFSATTSRSAPLSLGDYQAADAESAAMFEARLLREDAVALRVAEP